MMLPDRSHGPARKIRISSPRRPLRRGVAALLVAALIPVGAAGCFGSFNLTRKVYDFNRTVSPDRWIRWLFFLAMNIVPVYAFSVGVDAVFANPWEFWGGENPITADAGRTRVLRAADGSTVRATWLSADRLRIETTRLSGRTEVVVLTRLPDGAEARDGDGRLLGRVSGVGEQMRFVRAD